MPPIVLDPENKFTPKERRQLLKFIIEDCRTTIREFELLKRIIIRSEPGEDYLGYWSAKVDRSHGHLHTFQAVIVLNAAYLTTLEGLKRTLAHEYGHHWSLSHLIRLDCLEGANDIKKARLPWAYYRMRRLRTDSTNPGDDEWTRCDKEIMAEDYRYFFTPYRKQHRMSRTVGKPSTEVEDYLKSFCYRRPR